MLRRKVCQRLVWQVAAAAQHERLQARVHDERRHGVDGKHLRQLRRGHLLHLQQPRVVRAQVQLLRIHVRHARREVCGVMQIIARHHHQLRHGR